MVTYTDMKILIVVFLDYNQIEQVFNSLNTYTDLYVQSGSPYVYIVDKNRSLRGRNDDDGIKFGYDSRSVADINNFMVDDVKVILAEYRLALKKNGITRKDL